ncbi:unnamed protein product [Symbiodinium microadriaticum]|nr:unnamed protein product [Symbiodinium microadriaticum]
MASQALPALDQGDEEEFSDDVRRCLDIALLKLDWKSIRTSEAKDLVKIDATSAAQGGVYERIVLNFEMVVHFIVKYELAPPSVTAGFMKLNDQRGLLVAGTIVEKKGIRHKATRPNGKGASSVSLDSQPPEEDNDEEEAADTGDYDDGDDEEMDDPDQEPEIPTKANGKLKKQEPEITKADAKLKQQEPEVTKADAKLKQQEGNAKLAADAIPPPGGALQAQLEAMGMPVEESVLLLQRQRELKAKSRLEKASKQMAKGRGKAKSKAKAAKQQEIKEPAEKEEIEEPAEKEEMMEPAEKEGMEEPAQENEPEQEDEEPKAKKRKSQAQFVVADVMAELREIGNHHRFPMPDPEQQKRKCYTIKDPATQGCSSITLMANQYGFYVPTVSLDHLVRDYAKIYGVSATALHDQFAMVNKSGGSNLSFRKFGPVTAWKLALLFAGWVQPPRPGPNMKDESAVMQAVQRLEMPKPF